MKSSSGAEAKAVWSSEDLDQTLEWHHFSVHFKDWFSLHTRLSVNMMHIPVLVNMYEQYYPTWHTLLASDT